MKIEKIRRWQWILISLVVGFIMAFTRRFAEVDVVARYGNTMNSNRMFENGLLQEFRALDGTMHRYFTDLVVYPNPAKRGGKRTFYIVAGKYYAGRPEREKDGSLVARPRPWCFVEMTEKYEPFIKLETLNKPGGPDYAAKFKAISNPTVLDFLNLLREARGIQYRYAWWAEPRANTALWVTGSFVVIGLIWPTVVNVLTFGTLVRPREEKGLDLSKVRSTSPETVKKPAGPTQEQMDQLKQLEAKLQADLAARAGESPPAPAAGPAPAQPIRQLTATKLETAEVVQQKEQKEFGADEDDFYPTERHAKRKSPEQKPGT